MANSAVVQPEQLFRAIFEQAAVGVALIETATGRFVRINQRYCDITGLSRTEMTTTTFMAITHPDDLQADLNNMEELKAGRIREFSMEKRYFRADGSVVWVDLTVSPLWEVGEPPNFHVAVVQEITGRKQAEQNLSTLNMTLEQQIAKRTRELEESRQHLQAIVEGTSDAVFLKDGEGRYLLCNAAAGQFVGKLPHEVLGQSDTTLFPVEEALTLGEDDRRIMADRKTVTHEETITTADGVRRTFLSTKGALFDALGHVIGVFGIARDITERKRAEESLRLSEARLRQVLEETNTAVWDWDVSSGRVYWSREHFIIQGYEPDSVEPSYANWLARVHPEDRAAADAAVHESMAQHREYRHQFRTLWPDGTVHWIEAHGMCRYGPDGQCTGMAGLMLDITERIQAEQAVRKSEERFHSVFEHAGTGIAITDLDGRFLQCNPAYCALLGYTQTELRELNVKHVVHPDDLEANLVEIQRLREQTISHFEIENRSCRKDGRVVRVHKFVSVLRDEYGQPTNLFALVTDITEQRRTQETLERRVAERTAEVREREVRLANLIAHFPGTVSFVDRDLRYRYASPQYEQWFGKKPEDVIGRMIPDIIGREAFERAKPALERALAGLRVTFENCVVLASGQVQQGLVTFEPEFDADGSCPGFAIFVVDITERKRAEEALRLSEQFKKVVLDSLSASVAVVDRSGVIVAVNRVWEQVAAERDPLGSAAVGVGVNYLEVCRRATDTNPEVQQTLEGLSEVVSGRKDNFEVEYICLTPQGPRWFVMRVTPLGDRQGGAVVVHEDITERKQAEEEVRASYRRLQSVSHEVQVATERERSRLSRELHDEFGQLLSALKFDLSRLAAGPGRKSAPSLAARRKIAVAAMDTVDRLFLSLHEMIRALRPVLLDHLGFIPAIEALATDMRERWGLQCEVDVKCEEFHTSIGVAAEDALYRVAQELLTNVARHANAGSVVIMLRCTDAWASLTVQDDGDGFKVASIRRKDRFGLRGIQERVELLGGKVEIRSILGKGTCVTTRIPIWLDTFDQKTEEMPLSEKP